MNCVTGRSDILSDPKDQGDAAAQSHQNPSAAPEAKLCLCRSGQGQRRMEGDQASLTASLSAHEDQMRWQRKLLK